MSKKDPGCFYTLLHSFIRFRKLYMLSYAFVCFSYAFIRFSYAFIRFLYAFIRFLHAFIRFYMLLYAFIGQTVRTRRRRRDAASLSNRLYLRKPVKKPWNKPRSDLRLTTAVLLQGKVSDEALDKNNSIFLCSNPIWV